MSVARQGRAIAALGPLAQAAALRPEEPRDAFAQAIALSQVLGTEEAMAALRAKLDRHPRHRVSILARATWEPDRANFAKAVRLAPAAGSA